MKPHSKPNLPAWILTSLTFLLLQNAFSQIQFTTHILHDFGSPGTLGMIKAGDLDQDSLIDIIASGPNPNVVWFKNEGGDAFGEMTQIFDAEIFGESVDMIDYDGDHDLDLVAALSFSNLIVQIENLGNGEFANGVELFESDYPFDDLIVADIDGDFQQDIIYAAWSIVDKVGEVRWMRNMGNGEFGSPQLITNFAHEVKHLAVGHMNDDPWMDVVVASYWDFRLDWYEGNGNGVFSGPHIVRDPQDSIRSQAAVTADIDSDGDQDILQFCQAAPFLLWYDNDGDGVFSSPKVISADLSGWDGVVADFDLDGDRDIITGVSQNDALVLFINDGDENFSSPQTLATDLEIPNDLSAADLDGDFDVDVLVSSTLEGKYLWYENRRIDCEPYVQHLSEVICDDVPLIVGGIALDSEGNYTIAVDAGLDCDSVYAVTLVEAEAIVLQVYDTINLGEVYILPNGSEVNETGWYETWLTNANGCDSLIITHLYVDPMVATANAVTALHVKIWPNPASTIVTVQLPGIQEIRFFTLEGLEIKREGIIYSADEAIVPIADLPDGCFLIHAIDNTGIAKVGSMIKMN